MKTTITVYGKANLGYSPKFGAIIAGQAYTIENEDFTDQLFTKDKPNDKIEGSD